MNIEEQIIDVLTNSGLSTYHIAKICDLSPSQLSRLINRQRGLSLNALNKLTRILDIKITLKNDLPRSLKIGRPKRLI